MAFQTRRGSDAVSIACAKSVSDWRKSRATARVVGYGAATLVAGTATVTDANVTAASIVMGSITIPGGTLGAAYKWVAGAGSFIVTAISTSGATVATDTSVLAYQYTTPCFHADQTAAAETGDFTIAAQTLLTVGAATAADLPTSITLANQIKAVLNLHLADAYAHSAADATNTVATANASDLTTVEALLNACKTAFNAHLLQSGVHITNDGTNTVSTANATDLASSEALANAIKTSLNAHMSSAPAGESIQVVSP